MTAPQLVALQVVGIWLEWTSTAIPLVLCCVSGAQSGIAGMMLEQSGYASVINAGSLPVAGPQVQCELRR